MTIRDEILFDVINHLHTKILQEKVDDVETLWSILDSFRDEVMKSSWYKEFIAQQRH